MGKYACTEVFHLYVSYMWNRKNPMSTFDEFHFVWFISYCVFAYPIKTPNPSLIKTGNNSPDILFSQNRLGEQFRSASIRENISYSGK